MMHRAAYDWVERSVAEWKEREAGRMHVVVEFGSYDINGSVRPIFGDSVHYVGIDVQDGKGVDVVADAATWDGDGCVADVVVCAEAFEHTPHWRSLIDNAFRLLRPGGLFVATMAGEGRPMHSAYDESPIRPEEHYANIGKRQLLYALDDMDFSAVAVDQLGHDLRCWAER